MLEANQLSYIGLHVHCTCLSQTFHRPDHNFLKHFKFPCKNKITEAPLQVSVLSVIYDYVIIKEGNVHEASKVRCAIFRSFIWLTVELTQLPLTGSKSVLKIYQSLKTTKHEFTEVAHSSLLAPGIGSISTSEDSNIYKHM